MVLFAGIYIVVNLHLLRNVAGPVYLAVYAAVASLVVVAAVTSGRRHNWRGSSWGFTWAAICTLGLPISLAYTDFSGVTSGYVRLVFAFPVFLALILFTSTQDDLRRNVTVMLLFGAIASLSLPLQLVTGPIGWFASSSERAGLDRYASLAGSLTSFGIGAGALIVLAPLATRRVGTVCALVIAVSAATSLSKAGMANILLSIIALAWLYRRKLPSKILKVAPFAMAAAYVAADIEGLRDRFIATASSFGLVSDPAIVNYDVPVDQSVGERLTALPAANFAALGDLHTPFAYLLGGGYGMGGTALVPRESVLAPMAHNQFAELITVFGFILGGAAILGMLATFGRLWKVARNTPCPEQRRVYQLTIAAYSIFLANSLFANGTLYQPFSASIFYFALFVAWCYPHLATTTQVERRTSARASDLRSNSNPQSRGSARRIAGRFGQAEP
ncbi:hypothetical protein [Terrabacter sp. C0L_2]|uniref:hypothetical protein n=1 Tax=Terrabacter sp. C0L_2 TaxID=3108389 RepID=UPI002ED2884F|nr:hypothetical protein U5C87_10860 [Terrabacter sp. C0L_2]